MTIFGCLNTAKKQNVIWLKNRNKIMANTKNIQFEILGKIKIANCDCMDYMRTVPDNYFDLAIVDPPYGIGASTVSVKPNIVKQKNGDFLKIKNTNYQNKDWDNSIPNKEYFDELFRISKNQIIWGVNYFPECVFGSGRIVWDKLNGESDQYGCEIAYQSFNHRTDIIRYLWHGMMQGSRVSKSVDVANIQQGNKKLNEKRIHPTQKPVKLYEWTLANFAKQGDRIIDTHSGSLSLGIACHDFGYELTACELDNDYYIDSKERLISHQKQLTFEF